MNSDIVLLALTQVKAAPRQAAAMEELHSLYRHFAPEAMVRRTHQTADP